MKRKFIVLLFSLMLSGCMSNMQEESNIDEYDSINAQNVVSTEIKVDKYTSQKLYLWDKDNMPSITNYIENDNDYADDPEFIPTIVSYPASKGMEVKGAILICSGGAFQFRSDQHEANPTARILNKLGYQVFVVDYRVRPYTMEEGSLDLARAVRFVRSHANDYGFEKNDVAVMGFSAGGILCGDMLLNFDGTVNPNILDETYLSDDLDKISAKVAGVGMVYSFYGRLALASTDTEQFSMADLPPAYFVYGTEDPFADDFPRCADALRQAGIDVTENVLEGYPHGFGPEGDWIRDYDRWLIDIFKNN